MKVTIKQADIPLEDIIAAKANNLTYNNTDQVLAQEASIKAGSILVGKFEYSLTGEDGSWTPDVPTGFNAGDYKVYTKFTPSGNFKDNFEVTSIDAKILQKQIGYMLSNFEKTWNGLVLSSEDIEKCYSLFVGELQGDDQYVAPFTLTLPKELTEYLDAGTYTFKQMEVKWTDEKVQNYKVNFSGTGEVVILIVLYITPLTNNLSELLVGVLSTSILIVPVVESYINPCPALTFTAPALLSVFANDIPIPLAPNVNPLVPSTTVFNPLLSTLNPPFVANVSPIPLLSTLIPLLWLGVAIIF